jgi:acyl-CoA dehydrogenase
MSETADILATSAGGIFGDSARWPQIAEAGFHRLLLPEDEGGMGEAFEDACAVATQIGVHAVSTPLMETIVANWALSKAGLAVDDQPCGLVLGDMVGGELRKGRFFCQQPFTVPKSVARAVLVVGGDVAILEQASGAESLSMDGVAHHRCDPSGEGFALGDLASLPVGTLPPLYILALLKSAAMAGAMDTVLEMTVDYANTRKQFGKAIGQFQAIQHMIAQISGDVVAAAACVQHAARALSGEHGPWAVAAAKGFTSEAAGTVAAFAHQVHGAIGFTEEFVLQRFTKCLWTWREDAGAEAVWYDRLGDAALKGGTQNVWPAIVSGAAL